MLEYVKEEHLNPNLTEAVEQFKKQYPVLNKFEDRIPSPSQFYYGKEVWEEAICAIFIVGRISFWQDTRQPGKIYLPKI